MEVKIDNSFKPNYSDLLDGLKPFKDDFTLSNLGPLPNNFPDEGLGEKKVLHYIAPIAIAVIKYTTPISATGTKIRDAAHT